MANVLNINASSDNHLIDLCGCDNSNLVEIDSYFDSADDFSQVAYDFFQEHFRDDEELNEWLEENDMVKWFGLRREEGEDKYYPVVGDDCGICYCGIADSFDFKYENYEVTLHEDDDNFYLNFNTGLGEGIYPKEDWTLENALYDQAHIYDENK